MKTPLLLALLFLLLPLAAVAGTAAPAPVEGEDYVLIDDGRPYRPLDGKIEVVEVFGYWCPHCAEFQPQLAAWVRRLPTDVRFSYVPAVFDDSDAFARGFFAAERAGAVARTHAGLYRAVHIDGLLARNATIDELAWYYGQQGLNAAQLKADMVGPEVQARMQAAREFALRSGVTGTPTLIVDGRYRITPRTHADALRIAEQLIARLRRAR
ncbi:thiol:disulfide interchange protein DsbA/DsbL [Cognatiluteimonas weifangensis]|uniref:Thiol:disulfide interchange protein n=1 Tax=Cognatiluteimonas weifangensis TaxID=2303539 RepID=A0A372DQJ8_9GAMM|nr:thiol:disulfide interchange protein DsbA/DsbL [Luteimonas weifangensis]RFP61809.1 thiol:disulfide interchange protein DsbA/DsbL [Luteimonas weifangensis]